MITTGAISGNLDDFALNEAYGDFTNRNKTLLESVRGPHGLIWVPHATRVAVDSADRGRFDEAAEEFAIDFPNLIYTLS